MTSPILYQITTPTACFGVEVQAGVVTAAAPIAGRVLRGSWSELSARYAALGATVKETENGMVNSARPPVGWDIAEGAGGWRCVNRGRRWETRTYLPKDGGATKAIEAAALLEAAAERVLAERERLCARLRRDLPA